MATPPTPSCEYFEEQNLKSKTNAPWPVVEVHHSCSLQQAETNAGRWQRSSRTSCNAPPVAVHLLVHDGPGRPLACLLLFTCCLRCAASAAVRRYCKRGYSYMQLRKEPDAVRVRQQLTSWCACALL